MSAPAAVYDPPLRVAELAGSAEALAHASALLAARAADTRDAARRIDATGFAGPAADAALARLAEIAQAFLRRSALLHHASQILASAASAQEKLDQLADLADNFGRAQAIEWLNMMAWLLDTAAAAAMRLAALGPAEPGAPQLVQRPFDSLEEIHASNLPTVPAATIREVHAAGGLILESGPGGTTVLVGDATDPARVTTLVAGVSTGRPEKLAGELDKARRIAEATGGAVVVWQGYRPPPDVPLGINPAAARGGGEKLAAFQIAVEERFPHARKTILAHSYGTVVAAHAAGEPGLYADELWLLGSPGVPVRSAADMRLLGEDPAVFVVDADTDPITGLRYRDRAVHGYSPSDPSFGATVVEGVEGGHSAYFTDPDFLRALSSPPR